MATRVNIKKALEEKLRKRAGEHELLGEIVKLLDAERETGSKTGVAKSGLGYKDLVSLFRFHLGRDLVLPPAASPVWIIRMVNLAKQMGVREDNVEQIVRGLRKQYPRGPYQLSFVLGRADVHFSAGEELSSDRGADAEHEGPRNAHVFTGRNDLDSTE